MPKHAMPNTQLTRQRTTFSFPGAIGQAEYDRVDRLVLELFQECGCEWPLGLG